jgi:HAD superfamily hydrolase (TIGR01509 family)
MLTALCLDLMDTLVVDPYRTALEAGTGLSLREIAAVRDPEAWPAFEVAAIDEETFVRRFFRPGTGHRFDPDAFHEARRAGYRFVEGMEAVLEATAGRVQRYVASNYPVWIAEVVETFGLDERVEGVWASHHLGARKPDPLFFERLVDRIGHEPGSCLFVDDREDNCTAAEVAGMRAHVFVGAEDLRRRLAAEGILDGG